MTYACLTWEFAADSHLLKLRHLQSKVLHTIGNFPRLTPVRDLHMTFKLLYIYCGVFTPWKNCSIETRSRVYATVDEAVFSPSRAEPSRAVTSRSSRRIALPPLLPGSSSKHLDNARVGKSHVTASAVKQQLKRFPACQIKGL
jgi:hypothetical protein